MRAAAQLILSARPSITVSPYDRFTRARGYQIAPNLARVDRPRCARAERRSRVATRLRREFVFVQQPAEPVAPAEAIELQQHIARRRHVDRRRLREWRPLVERAVRSVFVVVLRVDVNDALELAAAEDQQPVETFAAQAFDPALGIAHAPAAPVPAP